MRLLLIDKYFPGHFGTLGVTGSPLSLEGSVFLSEHRRREASLAGVRYLQVRPPRFQPRGSHAESLMSHLHQRAEAFADAMRNLRAESFVPEAICLNGSSGCGFYAAEIFPGVPLLGAFEWFPGSPDSPYTDATASSQDAASRTIRNLFQIQSLQACDELVTASAWQRASYPEPWRSRLRIVSEGVDTDRFTPGASSVLVGENTEPCELVTFVARTLDPEGGCGLLCRALPELLKRRPLCHVLMVGHPAGGDAAATCDQLFAGLEPDRQRIHFKRFCSYEEYLAILRASSAHVFLSTGPVVATGLLEAMSCGCLLVASDGGPVREILRHERNALLTPYGNVRMLTDQLLGALEGGSAMAPLRQAAREEAVRRFDSRASARQYATLLEGLRERDRGKADCRTCSGAAAPSLGKGSAPASHWGA